MNHVLRWSVTSLLAVTMLLMVPGAAVAGWRVIPTSGFVGFVTPDPDLDLTKLIARLQIRAKVVGNHVIHQTLPTVEGDVIDAIAVCSGLMPPNEFLPPGSPWTFINAIWLLEFGPLPEVTVHLDETHLPRTIDTGPPGVTVEPCYVSPVADYAPAGAVELVLGLTFGSTSSIIYIGAVAVHVK